MTTCVALLRGINVGKAKRIAMADLRKLAEDLGHTDVRTLLNSGNLVFVARAGTPAKHAAALEQAILAKLGVASRVTLLTAAELERVARENPLARKDRDPSRLFVTVLTDPASRAALKGIAEERWTPEAIALGTRAAYLWCPAGQIDSPLAKAVAKALKNGATTRNQATIEKLQALVST